MMVWLVSMASWVLCSSAGQKEGLIVVPGLGRKDRLATVVNNIRILEPLVREGRWECVVYTYAPRRYVVPTNGDDYFWSHAAELKYLASVCSMVENPNKRVTEHLYMVQPTLIKASFRYVFVLLDDCKIESAESFRLDAMVAVMERNKLTVASPKVLRKSPTLTLTDSYSNYK